MTSVASVMSADVVTTNIGVMNAKSQQTLRIMTFNFKATTNNIGDFFSRQETYRLHLAAKMIKAVNPDIIAFQEPHLFDLEKLQKLLPHYAWFGEPTRLTVSDIISKVDSWNLIDKLKLKSIVNQADINAVMYKKRRLEFIDHGTFWLNEGQDRYKLGWGAKSERTCTWAQFKDKRTKKKMWIFNAHLDHKVEVARVKSLHMIHKVMKGKTENNQEPALIVGDFNMGENRLECMYVNPWNLINTKAAALKTFGRYYTYIPFASTFDYILMNNLALFTVEQHGVVEYTINGKAPSDHYAVVADVVLN